jgi:glycosyltransferase involved in cell wall biosynthesis
MKIGIFDSQWRGHHSVYASLIVDFLLDSGHEVTFFTASNHARLDIFPNHPSLEIVQLQPLNVNADDGGYLGTVQDQWIRFQQFREGMVIARTESLDVVHFLTVDWFRSPIRVATYLDSQELPIVATLHRDYWATADEYPAETQKQRVKRGIKRTLDRANRKALASCLTDGTIDQVLVHAASIRERLQSTLDLPPEAVRTVPAPTPEPDEELSSADAKQRLDLPMEDPVFLLFGALGYEKGPDILGEALRFVERETTVVFAGSESTFGSDDVDQWREASPDNVRVMSRLDYIPEEDVYPYFSAADVLVLPYRRRYGISGPLRRAVIVGTPAIGSEDTDIGSIIADNGLGETFEYANSKSLARTIDAIEPTDTFSERATGYRERIKTDHVGEELERIYTSLVNGS